MRVQSIYRYPVKGLSPESLGRVSLAPREGLAHDRRYALARPECQFDPLDPQWLPKTQFYMLMRDAKLARLHTRFDPADGALSIHGDDGMLERGVLSEREGRGRIERFIGEFLAEAEAAKPRIVWAAGHTFTDASEKPGSTTYKYVSLQNLASIAALEKRLGVQVDPLRFRANFYMEDAPEWLEFDWIGKQVQIGEARLKILSRTVRCAATMVNPATGERDLNVPRALRDYFGHVDMGVYAEVVEGGEVAEGAAVSAIS